MRGITGHARPAELKVNVCHHGGWLAEAPDEAPDPDQEELSDQDLEDQDDEVLDDEFNDDD